MAGQQGSASVTAAAPGSEANQRRGEDGHELRASATSADADEIAASLHQLRFGLLEDIAYHAMREQFLARLNRVFTGLQVFLGTSAIAAMTDLLAFGALWPLVISSLAGVVLLVIDPAAGAREHRGLRARLHTILAEIDEIEASLGGIRAGRARKHKVAADAPPAFRCIQAIAYNTAVNAVYEEALATRYRYRIGFWRRLAGNWLPMRGFKFQLEAQNATHSGSP